MATNFERFEELGKKIDDLRRNLPLHPNNMSESQLEELWDLINEQYSYIELLVDKNR
jgi:hypothetical protein